MRRGSFLGALSVAILLAACAEGDVRVIDGDTIRIGDERIRIENIDAPELFSPKCEAERDRAEAATAALVRIVGSGFVSVRRSGKDRFGRTLARVFVSNWLGVRDVGEELIARRLARPWRGRRESWCAG